MFGVTLRLKTWGVAKTYGVPQFDMLAHAKRIDSIIGTTYGDQLLRPPPRIARIRRSVTSRLARVHRRYICLMQSARAVRATTCKTKIHANIKCEPDSKQHSLRHKPRQTDHYITLPAKKENIHATMMRYRFPT